MNVLPARINPWPVIRLAALCALSVQAAHAAPTGTWTTVAAGGGVPVLDLTETLLADGRVLTTGGEMIASSLAANTAEVFQPSTNSWVAVAPMHRRRSQAAATRLPDGTVLVAGGISDVTNPIDVRQAELFDPATNSWTLVGAMRTPRFDQMAILLNTGDVLECGGTPDASNNLSSCELYKSASKSFIATGDMGVGRRYSTMVLLPDGDVLVDGDQAGAEIYAVKTGTWSATPTPPTDNFGGTLTLLSDGTVLEPPNIDTIDHQGNNLNNIYNPATNSWTAGAKTLGRVYASTVTLKPGLAMTLGGCAQYCSQQNLNSVAFYNVVSKKWLAAPGMNAGREDQDAVVLQDGRVLVVGGGAPAEVFALKK